MEGFEDTGVALPPDKRARMKLILQRLEEVRQAFARNIRDNKTRLAFSPEEMKGLPASYLEKARRDDKGSYLLGFEYPEYEPFMANAENEEARRRYYIAFNNRGTPQNLDLLGEAARLNREIASLYGLPSYAHFVTRRRMVESPETVHRFLDEVEGKVREVERREIGELRAFKAERLGKSVQEVTLNRWDLPYYQEQLKKARYNIDQEALRAYFPTDASVAWVFAISGSLYGVRFVPAKAPLWHPSVRYYEVIDGRTGMFLSGVYLDLFPRDGKYSHAAAFGVRSVSLLARRTPISVLVANLDRNGLNHRELETLLHEFGHILHGVLSRTRYASQGGTNVERDFVEAPSQMYEEWTRKKEPLRLVHQYCKACPEVDEALVRRLHAARSFGRGIQWPGHPVRAAAFVRLVRHGAFRRTRGRSDAGMDPDGRRNTNRLRSRHAVSRHIRAPRRRLRCRLLWLHVVGGPCARHAVRVRKEPYESRRRAAFPRADSLQRRAKARRGNGAGVSGPRSFAQGVFRGDHRTERRLSGSPP